MSGIPLQLVVTNNQVQMQRCSLYSHLHPMTESHHLCPESWWVAAGKPVLSPLVKLCPNCHYGVHVCIDSIILGRDLSLMPRRWVDEAKKAFSIAATNGLTPTKTL